MDNAKLSAEDKEFSRAAIATYKEIRNVVQFDETYRLESPYENARSSLLHIAKDKRIAVVFAYQIKDGTASRLKLAGLDAAKNYRIKELNLRAGAPTQTPDNDKLVSGATLMKDGLDLSLSK